MGKARMERLKVVEQILRGSRGPAAFPGHNQHPDAARAKELVDTVDFRAVTSPGRGRIHVPGRDFELLNEGRKIGAGGTKHVYLGRLDGQRVAVGVCGTMDGPQTATAKWERALLEPGNVARLRKLGVLVNPRCEVLPVKIGDHDFPSIVMTPYSDLPFEVFDLKNPRQNDNSSFDWRATQSDEQLTTVCDDLVVDIERVAQARIHLGSDSVNLAIQDGKPRLFVNDLGAISLESAQSPRAIATELVHSMV